MELLLIVMKIRGFFPFEAAKNTLFWFSRDVTHCHPSMCLRQYFCTNYFDICERDGYSKR